MEPLVLYDVTLKFESELFVGSLSEDIESFLMLHTGNKSGIGSVYTVSHNVNITATPVIPTDDIIEFARDNGIVVLASEERMYPACGKLYANGLVGGSLHK